MSEEPTVTTSVLPHPDTLTPDESALRELQELVAIPVSAPKLERQPHKEEPAPPTRDLELMGYALLTSFAIGALASGLIVWSFSKRSTINTCPA